MAPFSVKRIKEATGLSQVGTPGMVGTVGRFAEHELNLQ